MMKKLYAIIFILTLMVVDAIAQRTCGTDELHDLHMLTDANYAQSMLDNERFYQWVLNAPESLSILNGDTTYVIPVVIHVIHTGGAPGTIYNPADTTLQNMISYMNGVFAANYAGYPNTSNGGVRFPIRFELAQRKPDCSSTNGIIRYNASSDLTYVSNGVSSGSCSSCITDANLKLKARWPSDMYYNIYVVNKINQQDGTSGTFTAGYAQYPSLLGGRTDGTVILATQAKAGSETIVHELGHAFNLKHTFEGSTSPTNCPPTSLSGCTVDNDAVCDTDPHPYDLSCPSPTSSNPCMSNAPYGNIIYNIMSYYSCSNRFTAGQRTRFIAALHTHSRSSLWKSNMNLTSSGFTVRSTSNCNITITNPNNTLDIGAHLFRIFGDTVSSGGYNSTGNLFYIDKTCNRIFDTIRSGQI